MKNAVDPQNVLRPIVSLISKSEKVQGKLTPGTWQHIRLQDNLEALRIALGLMGGEANGADGVAAKDLQKAFVALDSMMNKTKKARAAFSPGTAQHTLLQNRYKALRVAKECVEIKSRNKATLKASL